MKWNYKRCFRNIFKLLLSGGVILLAFILAFVTIAYIYGDPDVILRLAGGVACIFFLAGAIKIVELINE